MTSLDVLFNKKQCSCLAAEWDCPLAHPRRPALRVLPANGSLQPRGSPHRPRPEVRGPTAICRGTTCPAPLCRALDPLTHSERYPAHSTARGTWWLFHGPRYQVTTRQALCAAVRGRYAQWECCQQGDLRCQRDCTQPGHRGKGPGDRAQARAELGCAGDREQR